MINYVIKKRLVFPSIYSADQGNKIVFQIDNALMSVGFKLSHNLFKYLRSLNDTDSLQAGITIVNCIKELVGDHVKHNVYFKRFSDGVPDTFTFWFDQIIKLFCIGNCEYGQYQHSYEEMLVFHEQFKDKFGSSYKVIHLGDSLEKELVNLFTDLAGSTVPLNPEDRELLAKLTEQKYIDSKVNIPIRENKAIVNSFLVKNNIPIVVDTLTDVLRVATFLSDGDVTLQTTSKFKSFPRKWRRSLLKSIDDIVRKNEDKIDEVVQYCEQWKRLGERLHVNEFSYEAAKEAFKVARKEIPYYTWAGTLQNSFLERNYSQAIKLLSQKPGYFFRNIDRIIRSCKDKDFSSLVNSIEKISNKVSGRVLLSLREFLMNRNDNEYRIFVNSKGKAHVENNKLNKVDNSRLNPLYEVIDKSLINKLSDKEFQLDVKLKNFSEISLPISEKNKSEGLDVLPRGSVIPLQGNRRIVRFFVYWKEKSQRTDYDLSLVFYNKNFEPCSQVSWTRLSGGFATHSGDITSAPNGASEFIDVDLEQLPIGVTYFVPTVNIYGGEKFSETDECFFGYMQRDYSERGKPFEAKTVQTKFAMRGKGKVCLPLVFYRENNQTFVKWMDLYVNVFSNCNMIEKNSISTGELAKGIVNRKYLNLQYLIDLYETAGSTISYTDQITSDVVSLQTLNKLIPL